MSIKLPNKKYTIREVSTVDGYFALPIDQREIKVWFWPAPWYKIPYAMGLSLDFVLGRKGATDQGWGGFNTEIKKRYPIQYWFRNMDDLPPIEFFRFKIRSFRENVIYPIKCFFNSPNKKVKKVIPYTYKSPVLIITDVLVTLFMEDYLPDKKANWKVIGGLDGIMDDYWHNLALEYDACYQWFAVDKKKLEAELEQAWKEIPAGWDEVPYEEKYGKVNALEKKIDDEDTKYLSWIVKSRGGLD